MRNNKKRGFTLVELLVVIAILAILATVSVVGYTSFIQRASISNDENVAAQLNKFLVAVKADSTGPFYGEDITEDNVWDVTQYILKESGLNELEPQAAQYGYHFYFRFDENGGGEYVAFDEDKLHLAALRKIINFFAHAEENKSDYAGIFFDDDGNKYFLCDTKGSDIADVIRGFHTLQHFTGASTAEKFAQFKKAVEDLNTSLYGHIQTLANKGVFVTKDGNFAFDRNATHDKLFFHEDATFVGNTIKDASDELLLGNGKYLLTLNEDTTITIPKGIKLPANSLNLNVTAGTVKIVLSENSWTNELKDIVDAYFTADNVTVVLGENEYKINGNDIHNASTYGQDGDVRVDVLKYNNPLGSFNIEVNDTGDKVLNSSETKNVGTVALDGGSYILNIIDAVGTKNDGSSISSLDVKWVITSITMNGSAEAITNTNTIKNYVTIDETTGEITFKKDAKGFYYGIDKVTVKATAVIGTNGYLTADAYANQTYTISVGRVSAAGLQLGDQADENGNFKQWLADETTGEYNVTLVHTTGGKVYTVKHPLTQMHNNVVTLANTPEITLADATNSVIKINGSVLTTVAEGETSFTVKVGDYLTYKVNVTVRDISNLAIQPKHANLAFVGNSNTLKVSDLFVIANGKTLPAGAELRVFHISPGDDDYFNPTGRTPMYTELKAGIATCAVDKNVVKLTSGLSETIKFKGTRDDVVYMAVFHNGVRISDDVKVYVVNGTNIRDFAELTSSTNMNASGHKLKDSIVLLNDITFPGTSDYIYTKAGSKAADGTITYSYVYGNYFTINVKAGVCTGHYGFVNLSAYTYMRDVRIVGSVFERLELSGGSPYGTNVVGATNGAVIDNCYLANCRTPLLVHGTRAVVELKNSVLYGGRYANVEIKNGTLKLTGDKVVMINQPHKDLDKANAPEIVGVGIVTWLEAGGPVNSETDKYAGSGVDASGCTEFLQYNFVAQDKTGMLPPVYIAYTGDIEARLVAKLGSTLGDIAAWTLEKMGLLITDTDDYDGDGNKEEKFLKIDLGECFGEIFTAKGDTVIGKEECNQSSSRHEKHEGEAGWSESSHGKCCSKEGDQGHDHTRSCDGCELENIYERKYISFIFSDGTKEYVTPAVLAMNMSEAVFTYSSSENGRYGSTEYKLKGMFPMYIVGYNKDNQENKDLLAESAAEAQRYSPWTEGGNKGYTFVGGSIVYDVTQ